MPPAGKIFVSYRREDSADTTGRIYDRLKFHYGEGEVVRDVDSIPAGCDYREFLGDAVSRCTVLLAVIGKGWLNARNERGSRRLDDAGDLVRLEIEAALQRGIPVIPLVVQNASFPREKDLPKGIQALALQNGVPVRPDPDFTTDVDRLICEIDKLLGDDRPIRVRCNECGRKIRSRARNIGRIVCPNCQVIIDDDASGQEPKRPVSIRTAPESTPPSRPWNPSVMAVLGYLIGLPFAVFLVIMLLCSGSIYVLDAPNRAEKAKKDAAIKERSAQLVGTWKGGSDIAIEFTSGGSFVYSDESSRPQSGTYKFTAPNKVALEVSGTSFTDCELTLDFLNADEIVIVNVPGWRYGSGKLGNVSGKFRRR